LTYYQVYYIYLYFDDADSDYDDQDDELDHLDSDLDDTNEYFDDDLLESDQINKPRSLLDLETKQGTKPEQPGIIGNILSERC